MTKILPTYDDLVREHGSPSEGGGNAQTAFQARHIAAQHRQALDDVLKAIEQRGGGDPQASEQRVFDFHRGQIDLLDSAAEVWQARGDRANEVYAGTNGERRTQTQSRFHVSGPTTYRKGDLTGPSWVKDMAAVALRSDPDAAERLHRNTREVLDQPEIRALTTTDTAGGDFVPPLWAINDYVNLARAQRVTANLVTNLPLPGGTDSINVPKIATGTAVAEQATQNTTVQNTDLTTSAVTANVATIAGGQTVAQQLLDQSPINFGDMVLQDLIADLASKTNLFVLNNNTAGKKGLLQETGTNAITYTDASPTAGELYSKLADARLQVETNRYAAPTAIVMHPRRWAFLLAAVDSAGRPLVVPEANGPYNAFGNDAGIADPSSGRVGTMLGLPVYVDPLIPTNLGAGTNEDRIIVLKADDSILYESVLRAEAFRETNASTLSVYLRVFRYVAFTAARQPKSTSVISGNGLITPVF